EGAVFVMVAHGLASAMLILVFGALEERTRTRSLRALSGIAARAPRLTGFGVFAALSAIGVPLLAGFAAELLLFTGAFPIHRIASAIVLASLVVYAGGHVWAGRRGLLG